MTSPMPYTTLMSTLKRLVEKAGISGTLLAEFTDWEAARLVMGGKARRAPGKAAKTPERVQ